MAFGVAERTLELDRILAAQGGDDDAFAALTGQIRRELHIHCYRMLGTLEDADDALQETMLRAWKSIGGFQPGSPIRAWFYRIATNVCLTVLSRRSRFDSVVLNESMTISEGDEPVRLDPYPEQLLNEIDPE